MSETAKRLQTAWQPPAGVRALYAVDHGTLGLRFIVTGCVFFLLAGTLAMLIRSQLSFAGNDLLGARAYNAAFTLHGTAMMFFFAVPILQGVAIFLVAKMIGARDLVFPRLTAYAYWCYLLGGLLVLLSAFSPSPPRDGWVLSMPLSDLPYSPDAGPDGWLIGMSLCAISALGCAIVLTVSILKTRAPRMLPERVPLFVWATLVMAVLILCTFPPLIAAGLLLGIGRAFDLPFFDETLGGAPLLWAQLFWLYDHWEPVLLFLPAAGIISAVVSTSTQQPVAGYRWLVGALLAAGALSFFSDHPVARIALSVPVAIHIAGWLIMFRRGPTDLRVPVLYVLAALFTYAIGGVTGLLLWTGPLNVLASDSQFFVAQLHYVLFGGLVFPLLAGLYHWLPLVTGRSVSQRGSRLAFWLVFTGLHLTFLPLFAAGLFGMPNRIYTYPEGLGWETLNLVSTLGGFATAFGVAALLLDLVLHVRFGRPASPNPWHAGTLEWSLAAPLPPYNFASQPEVQAREPLWSGTLTQSDRHARDLSISPENRRVTLATGLIRAEPEHLIALGGPTGWPLVAAVGTASLLGGLYLELHGVTLLALMLLAFAFTRWGAQADGARQRRPIAAGKSAVPGLHVSSTAVRWWGSLLGSAAGGVLFGSLLFAVVFLARHTPGWFSSSDAALNLTTAAAALIPIVLSSVLVHTRALRAAMLTAGAGVLLQLTALGTSRLIPTAHAYDALLVTIWGYALLHVCAAISIAAFAWRRPSVSHRSTDEPDGLAMIWHLGVAQCVAAFGMLHGFPYLAR